MLGLDLKEGHGDGEGRTKAMDIMDRGRTVRELSKMALRSLF